MRLHRITRLPPLLLAATIALGAVSRADAATWEGCLGFGLATLRDSDGCAADLPIRESSPHAESSPHRICASPRTWARMLEAGAARCGTWRGRWQLTSPPLNEAGLLASAHARKRVLRTLKIEDFSRAEAGRLDQVIWAIERVRLGIDRWIAPRDGSGVLRQLLTGARPEGGAPAFMGILGFVHLLAAAGIHLYALAAILDWGMRSAFARQHMIGLAGAKRISLAATIATWLGAWLIEGGRAGMLRPAIVVCLRLGASRLGMRWNRLTPLWVALAVDLAVAFARGGDAGEAQSHGRWVYALACGGGLIARSAPGFAIGSWILAAWWEACAHGWVSPLNPILSSLTVPLYAGILYPSTLAAVALEGLGMHELAGSVGVCCGWVSELSIRAFARLSMQDGACWWVEPGALAMGCAIGALSLGIRRRWRTGILVTIILARMGVECAVSAPEIARESGPGPIAERVEQLDVGQGDAALVLDRAPDETRARWGLIDAGPERALSERAWIELLASRGAARLDWVALTHLDEDHVGGLRRLALVAPIGCVATAREQLESARGRRLSQELSRLGIRATSWEGGCVPFAALPPQARSVRRSSSPNAMMSAVFVPLRGGGFYLSAGDAAAKDEPRIGRWAARLAEVHENHETHRAFVGALGEKAARNTAPSPAPRRILKLSHHGSRTSSDPGFLRDLRPTEAWISSGVGNRYGHPTITVLERLRLLSIPLRRTDEDGALR